MASYLAPLTALLLLLAASSTHASCPDRGALANFDPSAILGTWFMQKVVSTPGYANTKCNHLVASLAENDEITLDIMYHNITSSQDTNVQATLRKATPSTTDAKYTYYRKGVFSHDTTSFNFLSSDYTNYAVASFCDTSKNINTVFLLTRERVPSEEQMKAANDAAPSDVTYVTQDQANCPDHSHHA